MQPVLAAARAIFYQLDPVGIITAALFRSVIAFLTLGARQGYNRPIAFFTRHILDLPNVQIFLAASQLHKAARSVNFPSPEFW
jgi:hypothetical protein